ncbi:MAG TPA: glutathione S-transferase family protein [Frankiaceae bacterium]|jgi:glutathione S-transferase|nr:glutathione S-transferase family protein [Frankiaceae bacterium]
MAKATLTINSRNYGAWSLRSWLICKMSGLEFDTVVAGDDDPSTRAELLLLSPSFLVPCLEHDGVRVWDTIAIAEHLQEVVPDPTLLPADPVARAHCRSICGEMHSGFQNLRSALPMNIRRKHDDFKVYAGAQDDIDRVLAIWRECLKTFGGPWLFGKQQSVADAMYAPVCSRFSTYGIDLDRSCAGYVKKMLASPLMKEWTAAALAEPEIFSELEMEF